MSVIRILLVDDHGLMCQGLRSILQQEADMVVIGEANSGETLLDQIKNGACPDVVLMDVYLGGMSGIETTEQLKRICPTVHVIGLSATDADHAMFAMLQAGACSYLSKASSASELVKMIRSAYAQELSPAPAQPPDVTPVLAKHASAHPLLAAGLPSLTKSQLVVLKLLIQGYSNSKIAQRLMMNEDKVQLQLSYIFAAMGVAGRMEAVVAATSADRLVYPEFHPLIFPGIELNEDFHEVIVRGHFVDLTPTEYQVLYLLMSMPDQPVSKQELLHHIWHSDFERSTNLVEVTVRRLREKIEEDPAQPFHVVTVRKVGYKFNTKRENYRITEALTRPKYNYAVGQD